METLVESLLEKPFSNRTYEDRLRILRDGRPFNVTLVLKSNNVQTRRFSVEWLTRSCDGMRFYCWPCLLFSKLEGLWNHIGFTDMAALNKAQRKHASEKSHIEEFNRYKTVLKLINNTPPCPSIKNKRITEDWPVTKERARIIAGLLRGVVDIICNPEKLIYNRETGQHSKKNSKSIAVSKCRQKSIKIRHKSKGRMKNLKDPKTPNHEFKIIPIEWLIPPLTELGVASQKQSHYLNRKKRYGCSGDISKHDDEMDNVNCKDILLNVKEEIVDDCYIETKRQLF